ncbi:uncharacterized protein ACLA_010950 [Aspergillus clavatus NRRL 1]|uniref:Uncharacterized protein n=1 Tax=Aspergillus clavatus (strain ATCC 1007 / CBS 513.65 / DSM 816 / NCTC 3887 / NRRL 1 / QM 1276 / 107) TaxID=344612 RepID=A1CAA0_ASPCL|nr:uncharacterized protein ACLA_010950 [Aspergillus clavatus NRRL 1]EAW12668.1 conserved hypothetical protein [Aspergillus clavatus NRRL 1]
MDLISSFFPCIHRRKALREPEEQETESFPCGVPVPLPVRPETAGTLVSMSSQRMSVRIVEAIDSQVTICPEEPIVENTFDREKETTIAAEVPQEAPPQNENANVIRIDVADAQAEPNDPPRQSIEKELPAIPAPAPLKSVKLPEIKSRMIENIPEEDDDDLEIHATPTPDEPSVTSQEQADETKNPKRSTWRHSSRKSLVDIINLLQSTTTSNINTLRVQSLKWPLPPKSHFRPATALSCRSSISSCSSATATIELDRPQPAVKKERRMGAAILPALRLGGRRWSDDNATNSNSSKGPLFCE